MVAPVPVEFGFFDVIFYFHDGDVVLLCKHIRHAVNVIDERTDDADARNVNMLGYGKGDLPRTITVSEGIDNHESKMADLDGDGDPDILGKGYNHLPGNLHIWLNNGTGRKRR